MMNQELTRKRAITLEQTRQTILRADAAVANAQQALDDFLQVSDDPEPKLHQIAVKLERASRSLMGATKDVTALKLRR